jgi:hypothetical protein
VITNSKRKLKVTEYLRGGTVQRKNRQIELLRTLPGGHRASEKSAHKDFVSSSDKREVSGRRYSQSY